MMAEHCRKPARLLVLVLVVLLSGRCGPISLGHLSPLSGTWVGITESGGSYYAKVEFNFVGDLENLEITTVNGDKLYYTFDGAPHTDIDGALYVATATTTLTDSHFQVKGRLDYTGGKHKGVTRITIEGDVEFGSMTGTIRIAYPDIPPFVMDFKGTRN